MAGWDTGRPIFDRLPAKGFQDNALVDGLTAFSDEKLVEIANTLQGFYRELDPATAKAESLDYLAYLVGLSGQYYDTQWSDPVKRQMIANANTLWRTRGTLASITKVLDTHGLSYKLWTDGSLRVPFKVGSRLGSSKLRFYVRLPLTYHRHGLEFREVQRTLDNYAPAIVKARAVYSTFRVGYSKVGEPVFDTV